MMQRPTHLFIVFLIISIHTIFPSLVFAGECASCHKVNNVTVRIPATAPIAITVDGKEQTLSLEKIFAFHGHECPGATTAFLAIRYGLKLLFHDMTPERSDLLLLSKSPAGGIKDVIDLIMKGDNPADRTWPPDGMKNDQDRFTFTLIRKSTSEAVEVRLRPELLPADFSQLQKKQKGKSITPDEERRLHEYTKNIITGFPLKSDEELFGKPEPYKMLLWGTLMPNEMDRHLRKARMEKKKMRKK